MCTAHIEVWWCGKEQTFPADRLHARGNTYATSAGHCVFQHDDKKSCDKKQTIWAMVSKRVQQPLLSSSTQLRRQEAEAHPHAAWTPMQTCLRHIR